MASHWIPSCHFMEIKTTASLQLVEHIHNFGILEYLFNLRVLVDCLHDRVILHLLFFFLFLFVCQVCEVIATQGTEFHEQFSELWILSVFLHGLLRLWTHLCEHFHGLWVLERCHQARALHELLHELGSQPLAFWFLKSCLQVVLDFFEAQVRLRVLSFNMSMVFDHRCFLSRLGTSWLLLLRCWSFFLSASTKEEPSFETAKSSGFLLCRLLSRWLLLSCRLWECWWAYLLD